MRKITKEACDAFMKGINFKKDNTRVLANPFNVRMILFDKTITIRDMSDSNFKIKTCGYNSVTTRERLNGLPNVSLSSSYGQLYLNGKEWDGEYISISPPPKRRVLKDPLGLLDIK